MREFILGIPVVIVIASFVPSEIAFYQMFAIGVVSGMLSSAWLKFMKIGEK